MVVNDNAINQMPSGALGFFASSLLQGGVSAALLEAPQGNSGGDAQA